VGFSAEISAHRGAPFLTRRSANWTFKIERRVIPAHLGVLPLLREKSWANLDTPRNFVKYFITPLSITFAASYHSLGNVGEFSPFV
jgi:hypothetical protein